ncbi:Mitochondrial substrate/solute carrier [Trinorchestia longiramus]|nr:Mitochondrial substrate/solute carrier [Trinorchestia longiramus]
MEPRESQSSYRTALLSGACAGFAADVLLYPLDTIKTRLQSKQGFTASGGLRNIYAGLGPAALASAPGAALFFCSYEMVKWKLGPTLPTHYQPLVQMVAAGVGEMTACMVRVPTEIIKQRRQAQQHASAVHIARSTLRVEGPAGLYRGYFTTLAREIPFSIIQFPVWEGLKLAWAAQQQSPVEPWQAAVCGALAGQCFCRRSDTDLSCFQICAFQT